ncbi:MAG: ABC transporter ATP-binding protein [Gaiellales bacterium]
MTEPLLEVAGVTRRFPARRTLGDRIRRRPGQYVTAVDAVSLRLAPRETLGIVGESGSGKSTLARCVIRLQELDEGAVTFDGVDVGSAEGAELTRLRQRMQMVFQDPYTSLNPRFSVGSTVLEAGRVHGRVGRGAEQTFVSELLETVGLPGRLAERRPRELSGGQRQRVAIARALAVGPDLLIADEAVSSLDVSVQAQILNLFETLRARLGLSMLFISHQLSVIAHISDTVAVMYLGRIVEIGPTARVFAQPQHPYTRGLLDANPSPDPARRRDRPAIVGELPSPLAIPSGCRFRTRCAFATDVCSAIDPTLDVVGPDGHAAACHVQPFAHVSA